VLAQNSYSTGRSTYSELLDAQRALLNARLVVAQLRMEREKALAAIETWSAVDVEAMKPGSISLQGASMSGSSARKASKAAGAAGGSSGGEAMQSGAMR
jgi:hypothetical protein